MNGGWSGSGRLATALGRPDLPDGPIGESWDVADLPGHVSVVDGGPDDGRTLREVWGAPFPLLVKVLDANEDLSVQVHPDGDGAKEEAWVALDDGGTVAVGRVDADRLPEPGRWVDALHVEALSGPAGASGPTVVHVPPGTVHMIGAGALVWEVQTPSDVTWRLDDHGRVGLDGRPRAMHLEEAADILRRGPEGGGAWSANRQTLRGRRITVAVHPPGRWDDAHGLVAFLPSGGVLSWEGGEEAVPAGRTIVLPPSPMAFVSDGWMLTADVPAG